MRIVHVVDGIPPVVVGGAGRIALELARASMDLGHEAHVLTAAEQGALPSVVDGVPCHALPRVSNIAAHYISVFGRTRARHVASQILALRPDVVHAHTIAWHMGYGWIGHVARAGIPVVFTAHDAMTVAYGKVHGDEAHPVRRDVRRAGIAWNPLRNMRVRNLLHACGARIAVSDALSSYLRSRGVPIDRTVHNGVDTTFWMPGDRREARNALGIAADTCAFLLAGRLGYDKGVQAVLSALPEDAVLMLAGETYGQGAGDSRVRSLGTLDASGMRRAYAACDAVLVPSVYLDPFPTVCLEAMSCARAVVATCHGGAKEAVRDGLEGWVLDPRDEAALGQRLSWCTEHRDALDAFGERGRLRACADFTLVRFVETMLGMYAELRTV